MRLLLSILAVGLPTAALPAPCTRLALVDSAADRVVWSAPLEHGEEVVLGYTHSLHGVPQRETFVVESSGHLRLREVAFGSFDAAAYYDADPVPPPRHENGIWRLDVSPERQIPPAPFRVGYKTEHFVETESRRIRIADHIAPGSLALLRQQERCTTPGNEPATVGK